ncbi:MAG TPA: AAA family ATPase [Chloroflexia bacterium]|nr:AAA family ATPase [Chloroflexia bacterium]
MRLLRFKPTGYRNLRELPVIFSLGQPEPSNRKCSIRFLVGVNGTGKSNLLRFIAATFAALDDDYRNERPGNPAYHIPFELQYEVQGSTVSLNSAGHGTRKGLTFVVQSNSPNEKGKRPEQVRYENGEIPGKDTILPQAVIIYTSGDIATWSDLLRPPARNERDEESAEKGLPPTLLPDEEQPLSVLYATDSGLTGGSYANLTVINPLEEAGSEQPTEQAEEANEIERVYLVEPAHLPLAVLVAFLQADGLKGARRELFDATLKQVGVGELVSFALHLQYRREQLTGSQEWLLSRFEKSATIRLNRWEPRQWVFDLGANYEGQSLAEQLMKGSGDNDTIPALQLFRSLVELQEAGIIRRLDLVINKASREAADEQAYQTLLFENLSDGERDFLGRMALVHLFNDKECLFLLDEPEVHFNDTWKRDLVFQIEQALTGTDSAVILTTHESITLTDAYPEEVVLLSPGGRQQSVPLTLGTEPSEILRSVFGSRYSVGERAQRRINDLIANGTTEELQTLLNYVGPGYFRFRVLEELQRRVTSAH